MCSLNTFFNFIRIYRMNKFTYRFKGTSEVHSCTFGQYHDLDTIIFINHGFNLNPAMFDYAVISKEVTNV